MSVLPESSATKPSAASADPAPTASVAAIVRAAAGTLAGHSDSPRLDAELLLCAVLHLPRSGLIVHSDDLVTPADRAAYDSLLARRLRGEPIAYLTGMREFWSLPLSVTPDVLVPRPETELLVEQALARLPADQARAVLELGTGSGAIALALASERPLARLVAVDVSAAALAVAQRNGAALDLVRIEWRLGSWFDAVPGERFDLIVSNPPYVASADPALRLLDAEPLLALTPGPNGLEALSAIIERAAAHLNPHGSLLLEHGNRQADDVAHLLERHGFGEVNSYADCAGQPRVTVGAVRSTRADPPASDPDPRAPHLRASLAQSLRSHSSQQEIT